MSKRKPEISVPVLEFGIRTQEKFTLRTTSYDVIYSVALRLLLQVPWEEVSNSTDFFCFVGLPNDNEFSVERFNLNIQDANEAKSNKLHKHRAILFNSHLAQSIPQWFMKSQLFIDHFQSHLLQNFSMSLLNCVSPRQSKYISWKKSSAKLSHSTHRGFRSVQLAEEIHF